MRSDRIRVSVREWRKAGWLRGGFRWWALLLGGVSIGVAGVARADDSAVPAWMVAINRLPPSERARLVGGGDHVEPLVRVVHVPAAVERPAPAPVSSASDRMASMDAGRELDRAPLRSSSAAAVAGPGESVGSGAPAPFASAPMAERFVPPAPEGGEAGALSDESGWRDADDSGAVGVPTTALFDGFAESDADPLWSGASGGREVDALLAECRRLSTMGLVYEFGSEDPSSGGLDCSGTVQYVLERIGFDKVPRQANTQYVWLEKQGTLKKIRPWTSSAGVLRRLKPGDLLFWKGTYNVKRTPNVTHVMIYVGRDDRSGRHLMFGASSRTGRGLNGNGVDVYPFDWPNDSGKGEFIAYGSIPGLSD